MLEEDPNFFKPLDAFAKPRPLAGEGSAERSAARSLHAPDVPRRRRGLRLRFRPETLSTDTPVDAESHRWGARTFRVLGVELGNDPLRRRYYLDPAKSRVIGDITRGMPVSVETTVTCINPAVSRSSVKLPNIGALTVVHSLGAGGRPILGGEGGYILPDELTTMTHRPLLLLRPRTAALRGA